MDSRPIKILTLNLFLLPPIANTNGKSFKDDRTDYFYKHILPHYDILCLQEVFGFLTHRKVAIIEAAASRGYHYVSSPDPNFWSAVHLISGGLLILSRFPILESNFHHFGSGVYADILANKGVLHAKIDIHGHPVHLFTVHTQADHPTEDKALMLTYRLVRRGQLREMTEFVNRTTKKCSDLVLCMGDFNVNALEGPNDLSDAK